MKTNISYFSLCFLFLTSISCQLETEKAEKTSINVCGVNKSFNITDKQVKLIVENAKSSLSDYPVLSRLFKKAIKEINIEEENIYIYVEESEPDWLDNAFYIQTDSIQVISLGKGIINQLSLIPSVDEKSINQVYVFFHELGHFVNSDTESNYSNELRADKFAGKCLYYFGTGIGTVDKISAFLKDTSTDTHPGRNARLEAIKAGYSSAVPQSGELTGDQKFQAIYPTIPIQGGKFLFGSVGGSRDIEAVKKWESPQIEKVVLDFEIGQYEVSQRVWEAYMGKGDNYSKNIGCADCPVEFISFQEAEQFIKIVNNETGQRYRLPTEIEWEYVSQYKMSSEKEIVDFYKKDLDKKSWNVKNSLELTQPVGKKRHNPDLAVYDMVGNVAEWCDAKFVPYNESRSDSMKYYVVRGGSVFNTNRGANWSIGYRLRARDAQPYTHKFKGTGFRLAKDL